MNSLTRFNIPQKTMPTVPLKVPILDLAREYREIEAELQQAIEAVFRSHRFILGEEVSAFERASAEHLGASFAVGCASGTDALWLSLTALNLVPGQRVLTTPFTFFATASAILRAGGRPVFADIDPGTFHLSIPEARKILEKHRGRGERIQAALPVHLYGQSVDWDQWEALREEFRPADGAAFPLIEDAAQAFGAAWNERPAGGLGDAAAFSFYPTKNLGAAGDAGLVTTNHELVAQRVKMLRVHGMRTRYHHEEPGWNSRLDTLQAAILLIKLRKIKLWNARRRELASNYASLFHAAGLAEPGPYPERAVVLPRVLPHARPVFHQYVVRACRRDALRAFLAGRGIGSEVYYPVPLHLQPALAELGYGAGDFPESERAAQEVLALPIFPQLTSEEQQAVVQAIADFYS